MALQRLLADTEFVYRGESEPANLAPGTSYRISDVELASRLSFFLWSSIPDDELMNLAVQGRLRNPVVLEQQVKRMLADPRSEALVSNFTGQWLNVRACGTWLPSPPLSGFRRHAAPGVPARGGAVLRQHRAGGSQCPRSADGRLYVRERTVGAALRDPERVREPVSPRRARPGTRRTSWVVGERGADDGHIAARPDVAGRARKMVLADLPRSQSARSSSRRAAGEAKARGRRRQ